MLVMAPPNVGDVVAERYELKTPLRGRAVTCTFLANDDQIAALVALTWFDPANVTTTAWRTFARIVEAAAHVPELVVPRGLPAAPPDPPHCVAEVPLGLGFDRVGQKSWKDVLMLGERVVEILEQAYAATGVAHRALTPSRLCTDRGQVRLLDFGVAEFERTNPDESGYRAPEQPGSEDPRVDVYAIAVILFEMITGKLPKAGQRLRDLAAVPRDFDELIARALASDPGQRFPDYPTFRAAMRVAAGIPPLQPAAPAPAPVTTPPSPSKPPAPIVAPAWGRPAAPVVAPSLAETTLRLPEGPGPLRTSPSAPLIEHMVRSSGTPRPELPRSREPPTEVLPAEKPVATAGRALGASLPPSREPPTEVLPVVRPGAKAELQPVSGPALPRNLEPPTEVASGAVPGVALLRPAGDPLVRGREPPTEVLPVTPSTRPPAVPEDELRTVAFAPRRLPIPVEPPTQLLVRPAMPPHRLVPQSDMPMEPNVRTEVEPRGGVPLMPDEGTRFAGDIEFGEMRAPAQEPQPASVNASAPPVPVPMKTRSVWILVTINIVCFVVIIAIVLLAG